MAKVRKYVNKTVINVEAVQLQLTEKWAETEEAGWGLISKKNMSNIAAIAKIFHKKNIDISAEHIFIEGDKDQSNYTAYSV